jgi:hypothetical protein
MFDILKSAVNAGTPSCLEREWVNQIFFVLFVIRHMMNERSHEVLLLQSFGVRMVMPCFGWIRVACMDGSCVCTSANPLDSSTCG